MARLNRMVSAGKSLLFQLVFSVFLAGSSSTFSELYIMPLGFLLLALLLLIHLLMLLMNGTKYKKCR